MKYRWSLAAVQPSAATELAAALKVSPLLVQCLLNRGLADGAQMTRFLEPRLKQLSDPFLLPDMSRAVDRLFQAWERQEKLVIFGDYDVDGVTSTALLTEALGRLGWQVQFYLPHRLEEGYGLSPDALENCLRKTPTQLLLAVDCGSTADASIAWLRELGIDTIVLDHHQVGSPPPSAVALVNPHVNQDANAPFRELCSVGLAFKLVHAVVKRGRQCGMPGADVYDLRPLLDLVALGTIADVVPLTGENRLLVTPGLGRLNRTARPGLQALTRVAGIADRIGVHQVGFQLAPRLNAAGRLENALHSLQLLLAGNVAEAEELAAALDAQNRERQTIERGIVEQVLRQLRAKFSPDSDYVIVEGHEVWHRGVVGIVASRVLREFYRPTVILGGAGGEWRGSGRSVEGFDLAAALRACGDLLTRHGGHAMAAGLSLPANNLISFRTRLNELARQALSPEQLMPNLRLDADVRLGEVHFDQVRELSRLEPLGQSNPPVHLLARGLTHRYEPQRMGKDNQHLKMWVTDGHTSYEAVWWNCDSKPLPEGKFDLAFAPQLNEFNERVAVQLKTLDWRPAR
jgi:single-stranded-DNA-specific exonuclease